MTADVRAAVVKLRECFDQCEKEGNWVGIHYLERVMRRLCYPDRKIFRKPQPPVKKQGFFSRGWL